jgi:hypothetical protein
VLPALSGRAAELEALARSLQADLERATERLAAYSDFDERLEHALADAYRGAQKIQQEARDEADRTLQRALDERRLVVTERDRLRGERDDLASEIAFARRGRLMPMRALPATDRVSARDQRAMLAAEMRPMLERLLREAFGPRPAPTQTKTQMPPRSTLLRTPLPGVRTRRPAPTRVVRPMEIAAPLVPSPVENVEPAATLRAAEILEPVVPIITAAPDVAEEITASTETLAAKPVVEEPAQAAVPILDVVESPAIAASVDVDPLATASVSDVAEELTDETGVDPRVIALQLVDTAPPIADDVPVAPEVELAIEAPELEPMPPVAESIEVSAEPRIAEQFEAVAPAEARDIIEQFTMAPTPSVAEPELIEPVDAGTMADVWESAFGASVPTVEVPEAPAALLASPFEVGTELPVIHVEPVIAKPAQTTEENPPTIEATPTPTTLEPAITPRRSVREIQLVLSPITSFPQLLGIQRRIASLSSVNALQLRDFRNGVATFAAGVTDALSGREFGSVLQMLTELQLRLEGATESSVELRVGPPAL